MRNRFAPPALRRAITFDIQLNGDHYGADAIPAVLESVFHQLNIDEPSTAWAKHYRGARNRSRRGLTRTA